MPLDNEVKNLLQKVASFCTISLERMDDLSSTINDLQKKEARLKQAQENNAELTEQLLKKAADSLYESDFLTDEFERKKFLKSARENPVLALVNTLEKVCKAADVSLIGIPAAASSRSKQAGAEYDPVASKAFGWRNTSLNFDE